MLDLSVTIQGEKVIIEGLGRLVKEIPGTLGRALDKATIGIHSEAFNLVNGPGAKGRSVQIPGRKSFKWEKQSVPAGGYPVPVRTANLKTHLNFLLHGQSKSDEYGSFSVGALETMIYDSTPYARTIHDGLFSSAKFGPRPFITDGLQRFNEGDRIKAILESEIALAKGRSGL